MIITYDPYSTLDILVHHGPLIISLFLIFRNRFNGGFSQGGYLVHSWYGFSLEYLIMKWVNLLREPSVRHYVLPVKISFLYPG